MKTVPKVAVIIPTADRYELLQRAIESILRQTAPADEIIIVDNGISAVTVTSKDSRINYVRTAPRIGPGRSRNIGVQQSKSDLVGFLDDDDLWDAGYIEKSLIAFEASTADVVVGQLMRLDHAGRPRPYKLFPVHSREQRRVYYCNPGFGGQNFITRKTFFTRLGGFDESMPASVDRDLAARMLQAGGKLVVQPEAVAILCDHTGPRVRESQVNGNFLFIKKHWAMMTFTERRRALRTFIKRYMRRSLQRILG